MMIKKINLCLILLLVSLHESSAEMNPDTPSEETATFAGGCFWCMQAPFDHQNGVISTQVGYIGGDKPHPTYEEVTSGKTGHAEAIQMRYDPSVVSYNELLSVFWRNIDPTAQDRQFADVGTQYRTAIFYHNKEQQRLAEQSKEELERTGKFQKPIVTALEPAGEFYVAEDYHQKYYANHPLRYNFYKASSGREGYLKQKWGDKEDGL